MLELSKTSMRGSSLRFLPDNAVALVLLRAFAGAG